MIPLNAYAFSNFEKCVTMKPEYKIKSEEIFSWQKQNQLQ